MGGGTHSSDMGFCASLSASGMNLVMKNALCSDSYVFPHPTLRDERQPGLCFGSDAEAAPSVYSA